MNEQITIRGDVLSGVVCVGVRLAGSRLHWQAPGLDVYTLNVPLRLYAQACNLACNEAIARNIPAMALRRVSK